MKHSHNIPDKFDTYQSFFTENNYQMINIGNKAVTARLAIATGKIIVGKHACQLIKNKQLPKGDALLLAEVAGIQGAKHAHLQIPLCHPLALDNVKIKMECLDDTITVYCLVATKAKTGVEMEALAGVQSALLTIYDLTKMVEPALTISDTKLLIKEGGKNGQWIHPDGLPDGLKDILNSQKAEILSGVATAIITISDRASSGVYEDISGVKLESELEQQGAELIAKAIVADDEVEITQKLIEIINNKNPNLIITTGGTGISPKDKTYQTIAKFCDEPIPGIAELLRQHGASFTPYSWLSRTYAGKKDNTLIISLPGNPIAIAQAFGALKIILPHALNILAEV